MKALVLGEEPLREAVPSVADLIQFGRPKGMHIRQRDQLHTRRRHRIEAWQLAAGCGQRQRKGLSTVAKEVTAGQSVVRVEAMINLPDDAAQVIV